MTVEAPPGWDDAATRSAWGHTLQSSAWARVRASQGWRPEFLRIGDPLPVALVLWRDALPGRPIAYVPRGPVIAPDDTEALGGALVRLRELARERNAVFLKVDPELSPELASRALRESGFRRAGDIQPVLATLELDLAPDEGTLFAGLEKDTRWSVRQGSKRGVAIRESDGEAALRALYDLYALTAQRAGFITRTWDYYRGTWGTLASAGLALIRIAYVGDEPVAGAMVWRCGDRALYQTGATSDTGRKTYAAYALLWECILAAKRDGFRRFDLGGMPTDPTNTRDPMYGPYLFKRGFGGDIRRFVGAHDTVPSPLAYRMYLAAEPMYTNALRLLAKVRR